MEPVPMSTDAFTKANLPHPAAGQAAARLVFGEPPAPPRRELGLMWMMSSAGLSLVCVNDALVRSS